MRLFSIIMLINVSIIFCQNGIEAFLETKSLSEELKHAQLSVYVKDVRTNSDLINFNGEKALAPASGLKLFTTATALNFLGEDFTFKTGLYYKGKIKDDTLFGDIIIKGGGDPTLGSTVIDTVFNLDGVLRFWYNGIKKLGINKIVGNIIVDDNLFDKIPVSGYWYWIDLGNYYAAQTSALTINDNLYKIFFKPSEQVGGEAKFIRTEPELPGITFVNQMKTGQVGSGDNGYVFRSPYDSIAYLRGTIPMGKPEFFIKGSLPDPPKFAGAKLIQKLNEGNISITGKVYKVAEAIDTSNLYIINEIISPPLKDIVRRINKKSDNLYTSMLLKMVGLKVFGLGSRENGIKAIKSFLAENQLDTTAIQLFDGNGLSRSNTITAKAMCDLLTACYHKKWFGSFFESLSVVGNPYDDGSFKYWARNSILKNNAFIKSGYIKGVRSHSGFIKTKSGNLLAFSIIANNFSCEVGKINNIHKELMIKIAETF